MSRLECRKVLSLVESFRFMEKKDGRTSNRGTEGGDSDQNTGTSATRERSLLDRMPRIHGAALGIEGGGHHSKITQCG